MTITKITVTDPVDDRRADLVGKKILAHTNQFGNLHLLVEDTGSMGKHVLWYKNGKSRQSFYGTIDKNDVFTEIAYELPRYSL